MAALGLARPKPNNRKRLMSLEITGASKSFGGWTKHYTHRSTTLNCDMRFAIYLPPQTANGQKVRWSIGSPGLQIADRKRWQCGTNRLFVAIIPMSASPKNEIFRLMVTKYPIDCDFSFIWDDLLTTDYNYDMW
jgi:hypothetical protein